LNRVAGIIKLPQASKQATQRITRYLCWPVALNKLVVEPPLPAFIFPKASVSCTNLLD